MTSVGQACLGRFFRDTRFKRPSELEANGSLKRSIVQALNNAINIFLINLKIILYCVFRLNIYKYPKSHQHQYYHNQLKNHTQIHIDQFFSCY